MCMLDDGARWSMQSQMPRQCVPFRLDSHFGGKVGWPHMNAAFHEMRLLVQQEVDERFDQPLAACKDFMKPAESKLRP